MLAALFVLRHMAELTLFALSVFAYGWVLTRSLPFRDGLEQTAFACALGTGVLASLLNLLGLAGWLSPPAILALVALPAVATLVFWKRVRPKPIRLEPFEQAGAVLLAGGLLVGLALALYPPTGFDATLYHLPVARAFSRQRAISFLPNLRFPVFPQLYEMLFAASLSLSDVVTAQLTHFVSLVMTSAGLLAAGRRLESPRAGLWAAAGWLGSPLVLAVSASAYVDTGTALFAGFAVFAWLAWREDGDARWLTACGAFAGFAASTKYLGLFFVAALPAATLLARFRSGERRHAVRVAAVALLVLAPFYARILSQTGNPVFPFFSRWFGATPWSQTLDPLAADSVGDATQRERLRARIERFRHPMALARIPWRLVTPRGGFGETPPLSPALLVTAPLLLWGAIADRRVRPITILALAYGLAWYVFFPDKRYLLMILPAAFLVAAAALDGVLRRVSGWRTPPRSGIVAAGITIVLLAPGLFWAGWTLARRGPLPVTASQRDAYLSRFIRVYPALDSLNRLLGSRYTVYGLFCENAAYFAQGRFLGDHFGPERYSLVLDSLSDSRRLRSTLRKMGATHLLVCEGKESVGLPADGDFQNLFRSLPSPPGTRAFALSPDNPPAPISSAPKPIENP